MKSTDAVSGLRAAEASAEASHDAADRAVCICPTPVAARSGLDALPILPQTPTVVELRQTMVREVAYFRALRRGFAPGYELDDWLAAEQEIGKRVP